MCKIVCSFGIDVLACDIFEEFDSLKNCRNITDWENRPTEPSQNSRSEVLYPEFSEDDIKPYNGSVGTHF